MKRSHEDRSGEDRFRPDYERLRREQGFHWYVHVDRAALCSQDGGFAYSCEGPLTTAYELRGTEVFTDAYDDPEGLKRFLDDRRRRETWRWC